VLSSNRKGAIAAAKVAAAAIELGIPVLRPIAEHGRYDLAFEIGRRILRAQCKWGSVDQDAAVIRVNLESSSSHRPDTFAPPTRLPRSTSSPSTARLDRCYLLPIELTARRRAIQLRLSPPRNGQRACINLAERFEFPGAVAQLEERLHGMQEAGGSSPPSSIPAEAAATVRLGAHEFRNHFGYYMERAAAEIHVARRGKPYVRLLAAA
jgi:hypothetical protein